MRTSMALLLAMAAGHATADTLTEPHQRVITDMRKGGGPGYWHELEGAPSNVGELRALIPASEKAVRPNVDEVWSWREGGNLLLCQFTGWGTSQFTATRTEFERIEW